MQKRQNLALSPYFVEQFMGFNWCSSNVDIVEPRFLELSHIKHLMPERVHNFMLALYPCFDLVFLFLMACQFQNSKSSSTTGKYIYCMLAFQAFRMGRTICKRIPIIQGQIKCLLVPFLFLSTCFLLGGLQPPLTLRQKLLCLESL